MRIRSAPVLVLGLALLASACTASTPPRAAMSPTPGFGHVTDVTVDGIRRHLDELQRIAERNGDTRTVGSLGYEGSAAYVAEVLEGAGYEVSLPQITVPVFMQREASSLIVLGPEEHAWVDGRDLRAMVYSASGDVEAEIEPVAGGCSSSDFDGFPPGSVALIASGPCLRRDQVLNAQAAGASAVIGASTAPIGHPLRPTLIRPEGIEIPVVSATADAARSLRAGSRVRIHVAASSRYRPVQSVIAEHPSGDPGHVVMLGAHLDSVMDGPGIDDDGSGVATLLEIAEWLADRDPNARVRLAFWAAEEEGLYGSRDYVDGLTSDERDAIDAYLNVDVVGSPNFVPFVYADRPNDPAAAAASDRLAQLLVSAFGGRGYEAVPYDLGGGADHGPFLAAGIPTGGVYSGTDEVKTPAQAEAFGGAPGASLDPCYHQPCDTPSNVSDRALALFSRVLVEALALLIR